MKTYTKDMVAMVRVHGSSFEIVALYKKGFEKEAITEDRERGFNTFGFETYSDMQAQITFQIQNDSNFWCDVRKAEKDNRPD